MSATARPPWLVTPEKVQAVVQRLIRIARPKKIILFGSYARGEVTRDSDLDVLVITNDDIDSPRKESVRLRKAVADIHMPIHAYRHRRGAPPQISSDAREDRLDLLGCGAPG